MSRTSSGIRSSAEKELNAAQKEALAGIGAELDKANLADQDKAVQAAAFKTALDDAVTKTAEQSGLTEDVVSNIRSAADFQAAANGLSQQQQAILAGNLQTIIAARNAYDKANDALQKQNDQLAKQSDTLKDGLGDINEKLTDQYAKLEKVKGIDGHEQACGDCENREHDKCTLGRSRKEAGGLGKGDTAAGGRGGPGGGGGPCGGAAGARSAVAGQPDPRAGAGPGGRKRGSAGDD